jgi:hypothetical protein
MKAFLTFLVSFIATSVFGQIASNTSLHNEENVYYQALTQYLSYLKTNRNITPDTVYIEDDFKITDSLLLQSGQSKFIKLTLDNVEQLLKERESFTLLRLFPLRYENGQFSVSFVPFGITKGKKKGDINYTNPGSYFVVFKFGDDKFHFIRIDDYGI